MIACLNWLVWLYWYRLLCFGYVFIDVFTYFCLFGIDCGFAVDDWLGGLVKVFCCLRWFCGCFSCVLLVVGWLFAIRFDELWSWFWFAFCDLVGFCAFVFAGCFGFVLVGFLGGWCLYYCFGCFLFCCFDLLVFVFCLVWCFAWVF